MKKSKAESDGSYSSMARDTGQNPNPYWRKCNPDSCSSDSVLTGPNKSAQGIALGSVCTLIYEP